MTTTQRVAHAVPVIITDIVEKSDDLYREARWFLQDSDPAMANLLRRSIMSEVATIAIEFISMHTNNTSMIDETIAQRLGQLAIVSNQDTPADGVLKASVSIKGPVVFSAYHIQGLNFVHPDTEILPLRAGESLEFDVTTSLGTCIQHVKWMPVSVVTFSESKNANGVDGFAFRAELIGQLPLGEILRQAVEALPRAAVRKPTTMFARQVIPKSMRG